MAKKFTTLGINYGGHDTSAVLMRGGQLIAACEQERYSLDKHSRRFPMDAIDDCLNIGEIVINEVNEIAFAFQPTYHIQEAYLRRALDDPEAIGVLLQDVDRIRENFYVEETIRKHTNFEGDINFYKHHLCHLASAWYPSGFSESLVISYDGIGEVESGLMAIGRNGELSVVHNGCRHPDSLGLLYSAITAYLGWRHHCDEGIVMGLATYGDPYRKIPDDCRTYYEVFEEILEETGRYDYRINRDWIEYHRVRDKWISDKFISVFGPKRQPDTKPTQHHMDIAAALQMRLEAVVLSQLGHARNEFGVPRICLAGGVALNCSLNGKIERSKLFDEIFVQPASGDAGVALGACYLANRIKDQSFSPKKSHNFYLGSIFEDKEVRDALDSRGLTPKFVENIYHTTAQKLADGKIIGWFQGQAEFGPRALGNRSILTRPYPSHMKDYLNDRVKYREAFRPFAPAVLYEHMNHYFEIQQETPHMLIASLATPLAREKIPATVHVDNSCRVQSVQRKNNSRFYDLLHAFNELTDCPVLLNTSFNVKGQPIVNSPEQAIDCFLATNIDCLVIENYVIDKD